MSDVPQNPPLTDGESPGRWLARLRTARGLSTAEVAQRLKYAERQIVALEADDHARLPDHTFVKGMLRGYARMLDADPAMAIRQLELGRSELPDAVVTPQANIPFPDGRRRITRRYVLLSALAGLVALVVGLGLLPDFDSMPGPSIRAQEPSQELVPVPQPVAAEQTAAVPAISTEVQTPPAPPQTPATAEAPAENKSRPRESNHQAAVASGTRQIMLRFDKDAWVEIRQRDGKTLLSQLNAGGTRQVVEGVPPFALIIGNAPNVKLTYDDQPVDLRPHFKVDVARLTLN